MRHRVVAITLALLLFLQGAGGLAMQPAAPAALAVTTETEVTFPEGMTFTATIPLGNGGVAVETVQILYRIASDPTLNLEVVSPGDYALEDGSLRVETFVDFLTGFVPLGVELTYSWEVMLADGSVIETADEVAQWRDTRFEWDVLTSDQVRLYTYDTGDEFAGMMLERSQATIDDLERTYGLDAIPPLSIWVYPSYEDFRGTLQGNSREAIAGVTYPGMDAMVVIVPDGDEREFGRVVPHEISHQVLFAATQNAYSHPPLWFDEGMATHTQIGGTDNYAGMVANAHADGALFDIQSLESSFPFQPQEATLAYASSWSMIAYIEERWGPEGIARLIDAFANGLPIDAAVPTALGISLDELNDAWKAWVSIND